MSFATAASQKSVWGFSPQSIPGLQLWLDAADSTSITGTSSVTAWRNKGAAGGSASNPAGTISSTGSINGRSALSIGTNARMTMPSLTFAQTSRSVLVVATVGNAGSFYLFLDGSTANIDTYFFIYNGDNRLYFGSIGNAVALQAAFPGGSFNAPSMMSGISAPASNRGIYVNGTALSLTANTGGTYTTGTTTTQVTGNTVYEIAYTLGELLMFDGALTTEQQQQVEGYLAAKWGLKANLPAAHPYSATASLPFNRPFYPTDIPGCTLWMDAADRSSITLSSGSLSNISRWNDKSGQGNYFTVTEGTPVYSTTTIGNPGVFLPTNSQMQSISNAAENGAASRTSFIVGDIIRAAGTTLTQLQIGTGQINNLRSVWGFHWLRNNDAGGASNTMFTPYTWGDDIVFSSPIASLTTTTNIGFASYNSNTATMTGNFNLSGGDSNKTITLNTVAGPWWMGDRPGDGQPTGFANKTAGNSWICEFIQYSGVLTTPQRQQVESYLSWKWNTTTSLPFPTGHPGKLLPAFSTAFTPKSVAGLTWWVDGMDTSTMTFSSGSNISSWADKSGNGYTATGVNSPQKLSSGGVSFNAGSSQRFSMSVPYSNTNTIFMVASPVPSTTSGMYYIGQNNANYCGTMFLGGVHSSYVCGFYPANPSIGGNPDQEPVLSAGLPTTPFIVSSVKTAAVSALGYYNGAQAYSQGDTATAGPTYWDNVGAASQGNNHLTANIYELIFFNTALSTSQRQQVEGYLAWKWGLQSNLPSTHAYAKFSP